VIRLVQQEILSAETSRSPGKEKELTEALDFLVKNLKMHSEE